MTVELENGMENVFFHPKINSEKEAKKKQNLFVVFPTVWNLNGGKMCENWTIQSLRWMKLDKIVWGHDTPLKFATGSVWNEMKTILH